MRRAFTLIELTIVLAVIAIILSTVLVIYQRLGTAKATEVMSVLDLTINAIQTYLSDHQRYPNQLQDLNSGVYKYLPDFNISGDTLFYKDLTINYTSSDSDCSNSPSVSVRFPGGLGEVYKEMKITLFGSPGWRFDDINNHIKYCLAVF